MHMSLAYDNKRNELTVPVVLGTSKEIWRWASMSLMLRSMADESVGC